MYVCSPETIAFLCFACALTAFPNAADSTLRYFRSRREVSTGGAATCRQYFYISHVESNLLACTKTGDLLFILQALRVFIFSYSTTYILLALQVQALGLDVEWNIYPADLTETHFLSAFPTSVAITVTLKTPLIRARWTYRPIDQIMKSLLRRKLLTKKWRNWRTLSTRRNYAPCSKTGSKVQYRYYFTCLKKGP